jgi:DNA-binding transcriptional LysR family regulator
MTAAARALYVSQSAVSLAIAELERSTGTQLLIRHRARGLELTAAGRRLLPDARRLLAHAEDVRAAAVAEGGELRGTLTVGCFRTLAPFLLPELLERFADEQPDVQVDYLEGSSDVLVEALRTGRCELAIVDAHDLPPGLETELLRSLEPYALLSPDHPLADRRSLSIRELAPYPFIMLDVPPSQGYIRNVFAHAGYAPEVRHVASSYELVRSLVGRNLGYAVLLSRPAVDVSYEGRPLRSIPLQGAPLRADLVLAWPAGVRLTRRARAFADLCRRVLPTIG